ncbi:hypothetical protein FB567DRAFT_512636 [Paraphoma chrysanthemicola]|uniref:Uncharacterized protein n=1 Tax=Paraphoma chrysanthemicola TaxID=798071 RepID=A0A8K0RI47_9PLEO|nr:hypothetical protein FB567DRAFT_512636 [Paraphoma chrysanthemicola]
MCCCFVRVVGLSCHISGAHFSASKNLLVESAVVFGYRTAQPGFLDFAYDRRKNSAMEISAREGVSGTNFRSATNRFSRTPESVRKADVYDRDNSGCRKPRSSACLIGFGLCVKCPRGAGGSLPATNSPPTTASCKSVICLAAHMCPCLAMRGCRACRMLIVSLVLKQVGSSDRWWWVCVGSLIAALSRAPHVPPLHAHAGEEVEMRCPSTCFRVPASRTRNVPCVCRSCCGSEGRGCDRVECRSRSVAVDSRLTAEM